MSENNKKIHVLLVDDDVVVGLLLERFLKIFGCGVEFLSDSEIALEIFKKSPNDFDLVITDYGMPKLDGVHFLKEVLKIKQLPIILCTGSDVEEVLNSKDALVATKVVQKPISIMELKKIISEVLEN